MAWSPSYISTSELSEFVGGGVATHLSLAASAASRAIDAWAGRQFGVVAEAEERTYSVRYDHYRCVWVADIDDLQSTSGFEVEVDGTATDDYTLEPVNAPQNGRPYTRLVFTAYCESVAATGLWGWTSTPDSVKEATLLQASRFMIRKDSPFGVAGSPDQQTEVRLLSRVDPDVAVALTPYRRLVGVS